MSTFKLKLKSILLKISELLPHQGPIDVFIHHNTLHYFENLNFEDAVVAAAKLYHAEAFLPEIKYLEAYSSGRILDQDLLNEINKKYSKDEFIKEINVNHLIHQILICAPAVQTFQQVKWLLRERSNISFSQKLSNQNALNYLSSEVYLKQLNVLKKINIEAAESLGILIKQTVLNGDLVNIKQLALWSSCLLQVANHFNISNINQNSINDYVDDLVDPILIRFCTEYLDLGFSTLTMFGREQGMLYAFNEILKHSKFSLPDFIRQNAAELDYIIKLDPYEALQNLLSDLKVEEELWESFLVEQALVLKGWAGFVSLSEKDPELFLQHGAKLNPKLIEYLIIRLFLIKHAAKNRQVVDPRLLIENQRVLNFIYCNGYHLLNLILKLNSDFEFLNNTDFASQITEQFLKINEIERKKIWHNAYESNLYNKICKSLLLHSVEQTSKIKVQALFCIDDREESLRRYLEQEYPECETFGAAGFFGIDAKYQGLSGVAQPHCPVVIKPSHIIREIPKIGKELKLSRFRLVQKNWFHFSSYIDQKTGNLFHDWLMTIFGFMSFIPMILGTIAPRLMKIFSVSLGREGLLPGNLSDLVIEQSNEIDSHGYTVPEMSERVNIILKNIGLISNFSNLIIIFGHGSSSRNNPLRSAYDCGACGGRPGRMNARVFAMMANRSDVRDLLRQNYQINIPDQVKFIGAFHNTCNEEIEYYDIDNLSESSKELLKEFQVAMAKASKFNAYERCRRFMQIKVKGIDDAIQEVQARSEMIAEARPEYGHATNAFCIIGPRSKTRGLFLDRRSFLVSYDNQIDLDGNILLNTLRAIIPVCSGINLEYFFSAIDNEVYGAGTKLPHNLVSLIGVMNGTSSDLRTGLPLQMIEIHEAVRLLLVIYASTDFVEQVLDRDHKLKNFIDRSWLRLAVYDESCDQLYIRIGSNEYLEFKADFGELQEVTSYFDWVKDQTHHLDFVKIKNI